MAWSLWQQAFSATHFNSLPHRSTTPTIASLLPHRERLMLAPRRAKKRVSALGCMRLRSDVAAWQQLGSNPSGKAKNLFPPTPHGHLFHVEVCG